MSDKASLDPLRRAAETLVGQTAWGPKLGIGSFLTVEFGARRAATEPSGVDHGEFHLWAYCAAWRLDSGDAMVVASEDERDTIKARVPQLDGRAVEGAVVSDTLEFVVSFDGGLRLSVFPIFSEGFEHWILFLPTGDVYTAGPGSTWTVETKPAPREV